MLFKNITIIDENIEVKENVYVGISGDTIEYIGNNKPDKDYGEIYDGRGKLLMPGFYNAHAHSPMTLMRGYGENLKLQDWLEKRIYPFEDKLDSNSVYWGTMLAMAESIKFGIVSTSDMYYFVEDMARATLDSGAKNNISRAIVSFTDDSIWTLPSMKEMKQAIKTCNGLGGGRVIMDSSLHGEYTSNPAAAKELAEYTKDLGINMHVHVSETRLEHEECKKRHNGMTPVEYLNSVGIFDVHSTAAHCVWIEGDDYDILRDKGVSVASNPVSNLKLASGICNVPKLFDNNINVAIGTDSVASNNSLNFLEEIKAFAVASKVKLEDPTAVTPVQSIRAATYGGAFSQNRLDCGKLKEGFKADLIVLDINQPNMHPVHNLINNVVYSNGGSDILLTMVDGKVLYKNGEFLSIDIEKTIYEAENATAKILSQL